MSNEFFTHETAIIGKDAIIGKGSKVWHWVHVMQSAKIGENCVLGQNVFVASRAVLGNNVRVQNNVSIYDEVVLEDDVFVDQVWFFTNVINPRSHVQRKDEYKKTYVRKGASIGANATVVCGNEIGSYAFIGAGSVITKPVLDYALVVGNPGKQIGWVSRAGIRLNFDSDNTAKCQETGDLYTLKNNIVKLEKEG